MSLITELQSALAAEPHNIGLVESDALDTIRSPSIEAAALSRCAASPTLNLLEWFYPKGGSKFLLSTHNAADNLAKQVPLYVAAHEQLSYKQQHTVVVAVSKVAEFVSKHTGCENLLCTVLDGYSEWPPSLRAQVAYVLDCHSAKTGDVNASTAAVVCNPSASDEDMERVIDPIFGAKLIQASNKSLNRYMAEALGTCAAGKFYISDAAFKSLVHASNKTPIPSDGLGNRLLGSLISCIMPLSVPVEEKLETLNEVASSLRSATHKGKYIPAFKLDKETTSLEGVVSSLKQAAEQDGSISKIFRPKQSRQIARDFILIRDTDGRVLFSAMEVSSSKKKAIAPKVSTPAPLALPGKQTDNQVIDPTLAWFKTGGERGELVSNLVDSELITPTGRCHAVGDDRYMEAKVSPRLDKMILPKSSFSGFVRSLNGQFTIELKTQEDQEVFI